MKENLLPFGVNKNGRIYGKDSYDWSKIKDLSDKKLLLGELRHEDEVLQFEVGLSNVTHLITDVEIYDDGVYGEIEILDNNPGKRLKLLMDSGFDVNISSRATGKIENGITVIDKLIGFDYVLKTQTTLERRRKKLNRILNRIDGRS